MPQRKNLENVPIEKSSKKLFENKNTVEFIKTLVEQSVKKGLKG